MICGIINPYLNASAGGGGGGPYNRFNYAGAIGEAEGGSTETIAANTLAVAPLTMPSGGSMEVQRLFVRQNSTTAAGVKIKAVIYSDSSGSPGSLLHTGDEYTTVSETVARDIPLTFPTKPVLSGGTAYWIGFIVDGSFVSITTGGTTAYNRVSATYASGPPASPGGFTSDSNEFIMYLSYGENATAAGSGYISNTTHAQGQQLDRTAMPSDRFANDIAFLHITYLNTISAPTFLTPTGWTKIDEQNINLANYREVLYVRRIDGTEPVTPAQQTGSSVSVMQMTLSLWRGYQTSDPVYEAEATAGGVSSTSPAGSTISTLGANRTVVNFYSGAESAATFNGGGASGWADAYENTTTTGNDCNSCCSYKDVAVSGSVTAESRSFASSHRWRSMTLALIKA